jgi:hypothetical protein
VRRIALLSAAMGLLLFAAAAWAVTNTVSYTVTLKKVGAKPTPKKPSKLGYKAVLHIDSDPAGSQPDTAPVTSIYFAKQIKQNAAKVPSCKLGEVDGATKLPSKCNKAKVGTGTAIALAGTPGQPAANAIVEKLNVTFISGGAKQVLLVLNSEPDAPVAIANRVVPGDLEVVNDGTFGFRVDFKIPKDLQEPVAGIKVALTDFNVSLPPKSFPVKVKGKKKNVGYLELTGCPGGSLPVRAVAHFIDENGNPAADVTNDSTAKC